MDSLIILKSISRHRRELDALAERVEALLAAVDASTAEAREVLLEYQDRKRLASESLGEASRRFDEARRLLLRADDLLGDLTAAKASHIRMSGEVNRFIAIHGDTEETVKVHREATTARHTLRDLYRKIDRARRDAGLIETDGESSEPDKSGAADVNK